MDSLDVSSREVVASVANTVGLDGNHLVEQAASLPIKQQLQDHTATAIEAGVFGVPSMQVDDQLFWGFDDFGHLHRYLAGEDPLNEAGYADWLNIRAGSQRTRQ